MTPIKTGHGRNCFIPKLFTVIRQGYSLNAARDDMIAGLTVAIVALPLALALGIASGASPDQALVTAIIGGFFISFLGGSRVQIGGPTGAFVIVVFSVIHEHGYDGLLLATLMAGLILVIAGYAQAGKVIKYIPHSVVTGFTAGIAVIIATSQVKDFLGLEISGETPAHFVPKWIAYCKSFDTLDLATLAVGAGSFAVIMIARKISPKLPSYLFAIVAAALAVFFLHLPVDTIGSRFPDIHPGLPAPRLPDFSYDKIREVTPAAFTIAFLAGIEALLSAVVADGMTGFRHRSNQELVGQGAANIASALFGGLPATGAIARTATNIKSGGRTPFAGMFHAAFLLLFSLFATGLINFVPMAALAAILFMVAWSMSEIKQFIRLLHMPADDRLVLLLTFGLTVLVDLTIAIGVGMTLASLLFVRRMSKTVEIARQNGATPQNGSFDEDQRVDLPPGVEVFRIAGPVFFGVASDMIEALRRVDQPPKIIIVRLRLVPLLDASGVLALEEFVWLCRKMGTKVIFASTQRQPAKMLKNAGLGPDNPDVLYAPDYPAAVTLARSLLEKT